MTRHCSVVLLVLAMLAVGPVAAAQRPDRAPEGSAAGAETTKPAAPAAPEEKPPVVTHHQIMVGGRAIAYTASTRTELGYESDLPYETLTGRVQPWNFSSAQNEYLNVAETLGSAMTRNPALQVYIAGGYFDLATPFLATKYTANHMDLDPSLKAHLRLGFYEGGHMMYIDRRAADRLKTDLAAFIAPPGGLAALPPEQRENAAAKLEMARTLDAETKVIESRDLARSILEYAHEHQITQIFLGRTSHGRWSEFLRGSVINEVVRGAEGIDVHIVADR